MPAMKIAGLCLPLKPQKERSYNKKQLDQVPVILTLFKTAYILNKKFRHSNLRKVDYAVIHWIGYLSCFRDYYWIKPSEAG